MLVATILGTSGHVAQRECLCVIRSYPAVSLWVKGACGLLEESICSLKCLVFSCQLPETKLRLLSGEGLTNHREKTVLTCTCRSRMKHVPLEKKNAIKGLADKRGFVCIHIVK